MSEHFADDKLKRLCLICSMAGLLMIYIASLYIRPAAVDIKQINAEMTGRAVHLSGIVTSVRTSNGNVFMTVQDNTGSITAVAFSQLALQAPKKGNKIELTGTVDSYRGQLEVLLRKPGDIVIK